MSLKPSPQSALCFTCHDLSGSGSSFKTQAEFAAVPANDPGTAAWYSHPATAANGHTSDTANEFGGVLNRHASCADCHDPHDTTATPAKLGLNGLPWSASGSIAGASSVAVTNTIGAAPSYTFVQGPSSFDATGNLVGGTKSSFEFQLCFKCHSGFTQLPSRDPGHPSWWALDQGVEFDPLNARSFHPIEAPGTNQTAAMAASLSGVGTYKLWDFGVGDTIRCVNCHAGPTTPTNGTTADATLAVHASPNRGILLAPYRDRMLKPTGEQYAASDFQLCYLCHIDSPFSDPSATAATNFAGTPAAPFSQTYQSLHALHSAGVGSLSTGTAGDIDTAGAGQGNSICAECHFRLHSTDQAYYSGDRSNTGLVNFAPDVLAAAGNAQPTWVSAGAGQGGSCTLTCHGYTHTAVHYGP